MRAGYVQVESAHGRVLEETACERLGPRLVGEDDAIGRIGGPGHKEVLEQNEKRTKRVGGGKGTREKEGERSALQARTTRGEGSFFNSSMV